MFIYPIYNHNWRNISSITYVTRLASNEIFSPSNKIHREVGLAKDLSATRVVLRLKVSGAVAPPPYALMGVNRDSLICYLFSSYFHQVSVGAVPQNRQRPLHPSPSKVTFHTRHTGRCLNTLQMRKCMQIKAMYWICHFFFSSLINFSLQLSCLAECFTRTNPEFFIGGWG
jgi:hypothetical protein